MFITVNIVASAKIFLCNVTDKYLVCVTCPPAAHAATRPYCPPSFLSRCATVVTRRQPVAPNGCPMESEPPHRLNFSMGGVPTWGRNTCTINTNTHLYLPTDPTHLPLFSCPCSSEQTNQSPSPSYSPRSDPEKQTQKRLAGPEHWSCTGSSVYSSSRHVGASLCLGTEHPCNDTV